LVSAAAAQILNIPMAAPFSMLHLVQGWCQEAAELYGNDWSKIRAFLHEKRTALAPAEREAMEREFLEILHGSSEQPH
jgi:hypothetical protein